MKTREPKRVKENIQGKQLEKRTLKKKFSAVGSSVRGAVRIPYAELSNDGYVEVSEK